MRIKIQCPCETRFAFDVEPVNGAMPVRVNCPACGADQTDAANATIQQQLVPAAPASTAVRQPIRIAGAASAPTAAPSPSVPAPAAEAGAARALFCPKHAQEPATGTCHVCGKPTCPKCMEQFGYVCSVYCQSQADQRGIRIPVYAGQKSVVRAQEWRKTKLVLAGIGAAVVLLFAAYGWYVFVGSKPRTFYSLKISKADRPVQAELISTREMLLLRANRLALMNVANGKEIWSTTLPAENPPPPAQLKGQPALFRDDDFEAPPPRFQIVGDDVWVSTGDRILRFENQTGKRKSEVPIKDRIRDVDFTDASIMVITEDSAKQKSITHVMLPSGTVKTDVVTGPPRLRTPRPAQMRISGAADGDLADLAPDSKEFLPAGANVVQVQSTLLEKRLVAVQAMKAAPAKSTLDSGTLSARDSMKAAGEMLNEMQRERTGGVSYENESLYQVTLRRLAPADAPDWTGNVTGPPLLFPQRTVDALTAGKTIHVFNKKNQKLWEGKLSFPVADSAGSGGNAPCVEEAGSLYVFDKGVLTAFDVRTGNVRWRISSVGISQVVRDSHGNLYVATTSASPESIQYSQEVSIADKPYPVIMKVDAASGRVIWKADHLGDHCYISGKYVYVTEARISGLDVIRAGGDDSDVPVHHRIYRIDPGDGKYLWQYYQPKAPQRISVQKNRLLLQYAGEVRALSYLAL
ncbi:MAG TPA: PQQ-binding-like beta-propeller repeat protein [Candidatus Angelobacter sp.]|nr:PQQ-binding-like beta-propeller repeat protein [Candidatus Angelobacter sp.]